MQMSVFALPITSDSQRMSSSPRCSRSIRIVTLIWHFREPAHPERDPSGCSELKTADGRLAVPVPLATCRGPLWRRVVVAALDRLDERYQRFQLVGVLVLRNTSPRAPHSQNRTPGIASITLLRCSSRLW